MPERFEQCRMTEKERQEHAELIEKHARSGNKFDFEMLEDFINRLLNEAIKGNQ